MKENFVLMAFDLKIYHCRSCDFPPHTENARFDYVSYALREHELTLSAFDSLDAKASGVVQFVGIVLGFSAFQVISAGSSPTALRILALAFFAVSLVLALIAWQVRDVRKVPNIKSIKDRCDDKGYTIAETELLHAVNDATQSLNKAISRKALLLKHSYFILVGASALLVISLAVTTCLPLST